MEKVLLSMVYLFSIFLANIIIYYLKNYFHTKFVVTGAVNLASTQIKLCTQDLLQIQGENFEVVFLETILFAF